MVMVFVAPTDQYVLAKPAAAILLISSQEQSFNAVPTAGRNSADTATVLLPGAVWFVPAATLIVIFAVPVLSFPLWIVTTVPLTETVATLASLVCAEIAPSPARVTMTVLLFAELFRTTLVALRLKEPAALPIVQLTVLADVLPSDQQ